MFPKIIKLVLRAVTEKS